MIIKTVVVDGVVVINKEGKFWGCQYSDHSCTDMDWGSIENATISKNLKLPTDLTHKPEGMYGNPAYEKLKLGTVVPIRKATVYELIGQ